MVRDSVYNIERDTKATAQSAASAAQHGQNTARAAQSAAAGAWAGAGFQAINAIQSARAARAAEEQVAIQHAMAEQAQAHQFAMWRQTPDGQTYVTWRDNAINLARHLRERQTLWLQTWAHAIGSMQQEIPADEKRRFASHPARLKQTGLVAFAIVAFIGAAFAGAKALFDQAIYGIVSSADPTADPTYAPCVTELGEGATPEQIAATCASSTATMDVPDTTAVTTFAVLIAVGVALLIARSLRRRAARRDTRIADESSTRVNLYGFDPLTVQPGHQGFGWDTLGTAEQYTDHIVHVALTGHHTYPAASQLPPLEVPKVRSPHMNYPPAINDLLARLREQDGLA